MVQHQRYARRAGWMSAAAGLALLVTTGCALLDTSVAGAGNPTRSGDGAVPYLVVTVGGSPGPKATLTVAETIPDSTPLPRIVLPAREAAARPVASPGLSRGGPSAAAQASRPPDSLAPMASPAASAP